MYQILNRIIKFLASLWCAVALILSIGIIVAIGTFIESAHGADAAQILIYQTLWFGALLVLLSINLLLSALSRWPWKKKHIGFLTTHLGIILILAGSLIAQRFGVDGQISISEGETGSRITLLKPVLEMAEQDSGKRWLLPLKPHALAWEGRKKIISDEKAPFEITLTREYPKAKAEEVIRESQAGSPAVRFRLKGAMGEFHEWLFLNNPERNQMRMGPATVRFTTDLIRLESEKEKDPEGALVFQFDSGVKEELPVNLNDKKKSLKLKEKDLKVVVTRIFHDAIVEGKQLVDRSNEWKNPAIEFTLEGKDVQEKHIAFSNFPEFPTLHGMKPSAAGVQIHFKFSGQFAVINKNELRFIYRENELPIYQIKKGDVITQGDVTLGGEAVTGWMDFKFEVTDYYKNAQAERIFVPVSGTGNEDSAMRVIEVELVREEKKEQFWLSQGEVKRLDVGSKHFHIVYGFETIPLGFNLTLKDFIIETDPGTERPASFKSDVNMRDVSRGIDRDVVIQMNEPLVHRGYTVYQSAYQIVEGQPDVSIFTVAKDPGIWVKYAGAVIMTLGMIFFFYVKELSTVKTADPKMRKF